ncbi:MAG: CinA family protein [Neisseriaceae bacterium]|nr:CinA family protein [Neisseriaceae bacterium]
MQNTDILQLVTEHLQQHHQTIATAESCTGGLLSALLTDMSGSSAWFRYGWVTYSNEAKNTCLHVPLSCLSKYGAVSDEVVKIMADNAREIANADYGISISGIAGPTGGSDAKPVGTVYFGISTSQHTLSVRENFSGSRNEIRQSAVQFALHLLQQNLH